MFSTTAIKKDSNFSGKIVGTHQRLDQAARRSLGQVISRGRYFPSGKEIIHFEGMRGPDGLKRKSPGVDEPSHMLTQKEFDEIVSSVSSDRLGPAAEVGHENLDERSVLTMILDHRWNLVRALREKNQVRAAFEAAWMAHMITDGLTPAHHFPLSAVKDELMTDKEFMKVFGQPIKGLMHGRNMLETMRNNWLYWGAGGHMSKHIAYEYGVLMITAPLTSKNLQIALSGDDLQETDVEVMFTRAYEKVRSFKMYDRFINDGWTTELALETRNILLPEIVRAITLGWYSALAEAYNLPAKRVGREAKPQKRATKSASLPQPKAKTGQKGDNNAKKS